MSYASLPAHAVMDVWICSFLVFLACVRFADLSCVFGVLAYLFLIASSISRIKLILGLFCNSGSTNRD
jgi:hypothetical protein